MSTRRRFEFEFDDLGPANLTYDMTGAPVELLTTAIEDGFPVLYANRGACRLLAEIFAKLALGSHHDGFHLHLHEDFDPDKSEVLRITLSSG